MGAAQERVKRKHDVGGQDPRTGGTTPLGTGRDRAHSQCQRGGGLDNLWRNDVTKKGGPTGVDKDARNVEGSGRFSCCMKNYNYFSRIWSLINIVILKGNTV